MSDLPPLTPRQPSAASRRVRPAGVVLGALAASIVAHAQIDPFQRRVFQVGYTQPLKGYAPFAGYGFYYHNAPHFPATNLTLRLAVVPVYVDSELGVHHALSPHTDVSVGLSGGGFADSYSEIRQGNYRPEESFTGHSAEGNLSLYHLFNPHAVAPLYGVVRAGLHRSFYVRDDDTDSAFALPEDSTQVLVRTGLRFGGREPYLTPTLAGEFSLWHETHLRLEADAYGYNGDRAAASDSHLFWARALLAYTFDPSGHYFQVSLNAGTSLHADRFTSYRLGGDLEFVSEFPLRLPGYYGQEISAERFVQFDASYLFPLTSSRSLAAGVYGSVAGVDYLDGLEQPGNLHSGVAASLLYRSPGGGWQLGLAYAYGIQAQRDSHRGGHSLSFLVQYDLDAVSRAGQQPFWNPITGARIWRGILGAFGGR